MFIPENGARMCHACRHRQRRSRLKIRYAAREHPITCDCGNPAIIVIEVQVGEGGIYTEYMPLCEACRRLELGLSGIDPG